MAIYRKPSNYRKSAQYAVSGPVAILPGGIAPPPQTGPDADRQFPTPGIDFRVRYALPAGIAPGIVPNTHDASHYTRFMDLAGRGPNGWAAGTSRVEFAVRYIEPPFIVSNIFGTHNIARIQILLPSGWGSSFVSDNAELDINLQRLLHHSGAADPAGYGNTHVRNQYENVNPLGWLSQDINFPIVYNLRQHVYAGAYMNTTGDPTTWPIYSPFVENKTRTLGPGGWQSSRFSVIGNIIENKAVPIVLDGLDATIWGPDTFIAYRDRTVQASGWDSFYNTHYTIVYNTAAVIAPTGIASTVAFGRPDPVLNLNRTVSQIFPYEGALFGTAFAADRIRNITTRLIVEPPSGFPEVRHNPHPIAPAGIQSLVFGNPTVYEHFNVLFPRSTNVHPVPWVGEPVIENRNKTLTVFPSDQALYGLARVFNFNTYIEMGAGAQTIWGSHLISRRTRIVTPAPISVPVFAVIHRIRNVLPDPPSQQTILPYSVIIGLSGNPGIVPAPTTRLATIYPAGLFSDGYGVLSIRRTSIDVPPGIFSLDQVGIPSCTTTQFVFPKIIPWPNNNFDPQGSSDQGWGKPRLTPHTIYAPSGDQATLQAQENNPGHAGDKIDDSYPQSEGSLGRGRPWFGYCTVSNKNREIGPIPNHVSYQNGLSPSVVFGSPSFELRHRWIYPTPVRSLRFGQIIFLDVPQYVNFDTYGIASSNTFGDTQVARPPYAGPGTLKPIGSVLTLWGDARVELFNREVLPAGILHRGNPQQGLTNPWGLPLVGYPRQYVWTAGVLTLWGDAWVSHKNRSFQMEGWVSSTLPNEDIGSFADRMRVSRRNPENGIHGIGPDSIVGMPSISAVNRAIALIGFMSAYIGTPQFARAVTPIGWDSLLVGDIDRWEADKIKPYGNDLSEFGYPHMDRRASMSGIDPGTVPAPRMARPIYATGFPPIGFAGPALSNDSSCTNRVLAVRASELAGMVYPPFVGFDGVKPVDGLFPASITAGDEEAFGGAIIDTYEYIGDPGRDDI